MITIRKTSLLTLGSALLLFASAEIFASDCDKECKKAEKKYGDIYVGSPEIVTRERLVNDRLEQDRWLREQLAKSDDANLGFQGLIDTRSLSGLMARLSVAADPNQGTIYDAQTQAFLADLARQQQSAELTHRLAVIQQLQELRNARNGGQMPGSNGGGDTAPSNGDGDDEAGSDNAATTTTNNGTNGATPPAAPASLVPSLDDEAFNAFVGRLTSESFGKSLAEPTPHETAAEASPVDVLRDRLAYREEIRNEIFENQLDDRHDLRGHTVFRLNVDATVLPREDVDAWAVVEVNVLPTADNKEAEELNKLYYSWLEHLNRSINADYWTFKIHSSGCEGTAADSIEDASVPQDASSSESDSATDCALALDMKRRLAQQVTRCAQGDKNTCSRLRTSQNDLLKYAETPKQKSAILSSTRDFQSERGASHDLAPKATPELSFEAERGSEYLTRIEVGARAIAANYSGGDARRALDLLLMLELRRDLIEKFGEYIWIPEVDRNTELLSVRPRESLEWFEDDSNANSNCTYQSCDGCDLFGTCGLVSFKKDIKALQSCYAYASTPKESAQRLSDVASNRRATELSAALSLLNGGVGADGALSIIRQSQVLLNTITRQPLVVGYTRSDGNDSTNGPLADQARLGWIIGPKFKIEKKTRGLINRTIEATGGYGHQPIQNALAGAVVVPGWWNQAHVQVTTYWQPQKGKRSRGRKSKYDVRLPGDLDLLTEALARNHVRRPRVFGKLAEDVRQGNPARFLIQGENLWRSTRVTLGSQATRDIRVLPDMRGIIASFDRVTEPVQVDGTAREKAPLRVWTSEGVASVGEVTIHPPKTIKIDVAFRDPRLVGDGKKVAVKLKLDKGRLPPGFNKVEMGLRSKDVSQGCEFAFTKVTVPHGDPRELEASFEIAKLEASCKGTASGDAMEALLRISLRDSSARPEIVARTPANATAIYYKQAVDAKVQVGCDDDENKAKLGKPVPLTYPKRVTRAFPGFSRDTAKPAAQVKGHKEGFKFEIQPEGKGWVEGDPLAYKLKVVVKEGGLGDSAKLEFKLEDSVVKGLALSRTSCRLFKSSN